ncbi:MAG TPA: pur operon repressor [Synergistaceae bacterium]|nr:pur operon repressor [Synergistaceae bacterium]
MKGQRIERLIRMTSRFLCRPSGQISMTSLAERFQVSKTVVSDDVAMISDALTREGLGGISVDRGRAGGATFLPAMNAEARASLLEEMAGILNDEDRFLPGGLLYYSDILFNPHHTLRLGLAIKSLFDDVRPDIVMTSEVKGIPIAMFTAYAMGVPLAVCRFRNRASDGSAVAVHYPAKGGEVRAMYLGTKQLGRGKKVLIVDDFMRGGSTVAGMLLVAKEFGAEVTGTGIFMVSSDPGEKAVSTYRALLRLDGAETGRPRVSPWQPPDI